MPSSASRLAVVVSLACASGCLTQPIEQTPPADASSSSGEAATTLPLPEPGSTGPGPGSTTMADTTGGSSTGDGGLGEGQECELMLQDCADGLKCMPYSTNPGRGWPLWDGSACFPVHPDPVGMGEPCQWFDGLFSGYDDCGFGAVCLQWSDEGPGECRDLCRLQDPGDTSWDTLYCPDGTTAPTSCQECFCWCGAVCNPLAPDCEEAQGCYPVNSRFECLPDASGATGGAGDPCDYVNACDPGLFCLDTSATAGCESPYGCCSPACDITQPNTCPGPGQSCQAWYREGTAPLGLEDLGACALAA